MAGTNLYMNWTGVTATLTGGGSPIAIAEVTDIEVDRSGDPKDWFADADVFAKAKVVKNQKRTIKITTGSINKAGTLTIGSSYTVVFIANDLYNGTGSGAATFTAVTAICVGLPFAGKNNDFTTGDIMFECIASDGVTDPLSVAVAA